MLAMRRPGGMGAALHLPQHQTPTQSHALKTSRRGDHPRTAAPRLATRERDREATQTQDDSLQQHGHLKRAFFSRATTPHPRRPPGRRHSDSQSGLACAQIEPISSFWKCAILLVFVAQSMPHRFKSFMECLFWVSMELYIPKTTKTASFF